MKTLSIKNLYLYIGLLALAISITMAGFIAKGSAAPSNVFPEATATATTTVSYVSPGVSQTFQVDSPTFSSGKIVNVSTVDAASVFVQVAASSTTSAITVTPQISNNNVDWYSIGQATSTAVLTGTTTVSTGTIYVWVPGTTATTGVAFLLPAVPAFHERLVFGAAVGSSSIYAEVDLKKNPSTP